MRPGVFSLLLDGELRRYVVADLDVVLHGVTNVTAGGDVGEDLVNDDLADVLGAAEDDEGDALGDALPLADVDDGELSVPAVDVAQWVKDRLPR